MCPQWTCQSACGRAANDLNNDGSVCASPPIHVEVDEDDEEDDDDEEEEEVVVVVVVLVAVAAGVDDALTTVVVVVVVAVVTVMVDADGEAVGVGGVSNGRKPTTRAPAQP